MTAELYIPEVDTARDLYYRHRAVVFTDPAGEYGFLSNLAPGYPVIVNRIEFLTPEALFQAFKFPHNPRLQRKLAKMKDGYCARKTGDSAKDAREDWDEVKLDARRYAAAAKLLNHPEFGRRLLKTGQKPIVEMNFRDPFWCAVPDLEQRVMIGRNAAGKVLEQLREEIRQSYMDPVQAARNVMLDTRTDQLLINGRPAAAEARAPAGSAYSSAARISSSST